MFAVKDYLPPFRLNKNERRVTQTNKRPQLFADAHCACVVTVQQQVKRFLKKLPEYMAQAALFKNTIHDVTKAPQSRVTS